MINEALFKRIEIENKQNVIFLLSQIHSTGGRLIINEQNRNCISDMTIEDFIYNCFQNCEMFDEIEDLETFIVIEEILFNKIVNHPLILNYEFLY